MRGLALVGVMMTACSIDNPLFAPANTHDGTTADSGATTGVVLTTGPKPTTDTSTGAVSETATDSTMTGGTDTDGMVGCGDGVVQPELGEACDDGVNNGVLGFCDAACAATLVCGDDIITPPEACDDGNDQNGDGCDATCVLESCGDGELDAGEQCDDGNQEDGDECTNGCLHATCGDQIVQDGVEACDDGNLDDADACRNTCVLAVCGDGVVQDGVEQCDDGNGSNGDGCLNSCKLAICGDGVVNQNAEQCDLGPGKNTDQAGCTSKCMAAKCGDGFVHVGVEECDDGNLADADACRNTCQLNFCLRIDNTKIEDIKPNSLDTCVQKQMSGKKNVAIALLQGKNLVYSGVGPITQNWTQTNITASKAGDLQYNVANHDNLITLKNGDKLMITGNKASAGVGCWQAMGNGYGIVVYPPVPDPIKNPKLMVMSYNGGVAPVPRMFPMWSPSSEISWLGGEGMTVCEAMGPTPALEHVFFMHVF